MDEDVALVQLCPTRGPLAAWGFCVAQFRFTL